MVCWPDGGTAGLLARDHLDALAVDRDRQNLAASLDDGRFDAGAGIRFDEQDDATAAARAADLAGQSAVAPRASNDAVYRPGRDGGQIPFAEGPLFSHQASGLVPVGLLH